MYAPSRTAFFCACMFGNSSCGVFSIASPLLALICALFLKTSPPKLFQISSDFDSRDSDDGALSLAFLCRAGVCATWLTVVHSLTFSRLLQMPNFALIKQLSKPSVIRKQFTHGGTHNPNWRTRDAFAARAREQTEFLSEADIETLSAFQNAPAEVSTAPEVETLTQEARYAKKLAELDPRMKNLAVEDFIIASDIVISPKDGLDIDSEIIGEGSCDLAVKN